MLRAWPLSVNKNRISRTESDKHVTVSKVQPNKIHNRSDGSQRASFELLSQKIKEILFPESQKAALQLTRYCHRSRDVWHSSNIIQGEQHEHKADRGTSSRDLISTDQLRPAIKRRLN